MSVAALTAKPPKPVPVAIYFFYNPFVEVTGTTCQLNISWPTAKCMSGCDPRLSAWGESGAKRMLRAMSTARTSASVSRAGNGSTVSRTTEGSQEFAGGNSVAETTLPAESTSTCTTLGAITSELG